MLNKLDSRKSFSDNHPGDSSNGQLLRDIEEISKALYLPKPSPNEVRSKSAGRIRLSESKSDLNLKNVSYKDKKSSSLWNWKNPLKALTHIGNKKFYCCFYLHVHSIEGLPSIFENLSLCVHWKKKNEAIQTSPSRVSQGVAEFDETLMHRCSVYGSSGGANHPMKYDSKLLLLYASLVENPSLDIGKQWVDLTSFLPRTMEELEGEKSSGKWTTSFNLSGKAKGASLNVSFGFWVMRDKLVKLSSNSNYPELLNVSRNRLSTIDDGVDLVPSNYNRTLPRVRSITSSVSYEPDFLCQSLDMKVCHEVLLRTGLELSKSINCLYQKLDEGNLCISTDSASQQLEQFKPKFDYDFVSSGEMEDNDCEITEFSITEMGTEMSEKDESTWDQGADLFIEPIFEATETINVNEIIKGSDTDLYSEDNSCMSCVEKILVDARKNETQSNCTNELTKEELESARISQLIAESANLDPIDFGGYIEQESLMEAKSNNKASRSVKRSFSLDDVAESVATDFLNMLGVDDELYTENFYSQPDSPRELLWRQFEKEAIDSGNFILDFDAKQEESEFGCSISPRFSCQDYSEESELSLIVQDAEEEHKRSELLNRRKAKVLEDIETEVLMREWGINEEDFQNSPHSYSGGFGSPIELPPQERHLLPPLEEGFGPYVQMKNGGFLCTMNPLLFRKAKNGGSLIIQVSDSVVLPSKIGHDVMEILQHLAFSGANKLYAQISKLMPLEDITGKTIKKVAWDTPPISMALQRKFHSQHDHFGRKGGYEYQSGLQHNDIKSGFTGGEVHLEFASLEDVSSLVVNKIDTLILEGLKAQSHMSDEEPPSCIYPQITGEISSSGGTNRFLNSDVGALKLWDVRDDGNNISDLVDLSVKLDEWLRLDAGIIGDEIENVNKDILKILAAHHAECIDLDSGSLKQDFNWHEVSGRRCGMLGNNITIAHLVQLRDPLRNYEPVGVPMLLLIQVRREEQVHPVVDEVSGIKKNQTVKDGEDSPRFQITGTHLAGVDTVPFNKQLWGTTAQRQSGSRWLLTSGMGRNGGYKSKSKAIVKSSPLGISANVQPRDILWSISSNVNELGATWNNSVSPQTRNPDVIFQTETISDHR
ncbi:protein PLASTID MOVEMENT IMPAIRED 1-RELATED 1-like [Humulus lupulus]|uniref:protein PLASTID MOVEMENT IMPAIRED 1-RELATED 1-like n=1 Tax=Humulus lupulus TaxID=3486 RepID=UPI002B41107A|nr:protein PLASTID MOVEMENT IMPAIRED 1-RELATED 1-like [Humulus lupulus]XP_062099398.1 protein PLASTID MOVEMENT IMPAIRED 1-RELATED 1-like [Humulus lupulus]